MDDFYFSGQTLDDVMHSVIEAVLAHGYQIHPSKGKAAELAGVLLEISDPRARLSRTETRGKPFSCLGELCWYLAKSNKLDFISYYIPQYKQFAERNVIFGGYGPRLFDLRGEDQVANATDILRRKRDSRQAVIQLFEATDIAEEHEDVPCTCALQFLLRGNELHMITYMRSNDAFLGLPHDIFFFTMLQEIIARTLSAELGTYKHVVGSLHLYDRDTDLARQFLDEGWQSTETAMPPMPPGDPWPALRLLLDAEETLRKGGSLDTRLETLEPYWLDLIRLLQVFRFFKEHDADRIEELRRKMSSPIYDPFIYNKLTKCKERSERQRSM